MIKFTIVTITYNAADVFMRTADSVARQTYAAVEHLIIDGASSDGTQNIAEEYKKASDAACNGHEVRIISEPDKGLYDAMNKGAGWLRAIMCVSSMPETSSRRPIRWMLLLPTHVLKSAAAKENRCRECCMATPTGWIITATI